jgi:hypothetical protein
MKWITEKGTVTLTEREVADLALHAAGYDVLNGHAYNPIPMVRAKVVKR